MARLSGIAFSFVVMVLLHCAAAQTVYIVGDSIGWDVPSGGAQAYTSWADGKNFIVGDILTFNFMTNSHDVLRVPKSSFDACTQANPIGDIITTGPVNITLQAPGEHYYICTVGPHCGAGQKLSITVSGTGTGTPGGGPPPTTTTPTSPSPSSNNNTPPGAECPTESPTSSPTGPTPTGTPTTALPPPNSSSSKILGSILVTLVAAALALGF